MTSASQQQTGDAFGYQWQRTDAFDTPEMREFTKNWQLERYGEVAKMPWWSEYGDRPKVLDAGCGAGLSAVEMFGPILHKIDYLGVDISDAYKVAASRFAERNLAGRHEKGDFTKIPDREAFDVILAEGTLHHTDDTRFALQSLTANLKPGGRILFYVYRTKAPIREFTDDYIRDRLQGLAPKDAWDALYPLTELGKMLGELKLEVDVPKAVDVLGIPAGKIDIQRLFYWYVFKAWHHPDFTLDEMNHINFDWYSPKNSHRQSTDQVKAWCTDLGLNIEHLYEEDAGISVIAKKKG